VLQQGEDGEQELIIHITRVNGIQQGTEEIINTRVITEPIPRIIELGTMQMEDN